MRLMWKNSTPIFAVLFFSLCLLGFLNLHKFEQLLDGLATTRIKVTAAESKAAIEQSMQLGVPLAELQNIQSVIERAHSFDAEIKAVSVIDLGMGHGEILYASGPQPAKVPAKWLSAKSRAGNGNWHRVDEHGQLIIGWPLMDPLDRVVGMLVFSVSRDRHANIVDLMQQHLAMVVVGLGVVLWLATALILRLLLRPNARLGAPVNDAARKQESLLARRIVWYASTVMVTLSLGLSAYALHLFDEQLVPEVDAKSFAVARSVQSDIDRALGYGIPFAELRGVDEFLRETIEENPELAEIAILDADGHVRYVTRSTAMAAESRSIHQPLTATSASIVVQVRADYVRNKLLEVLIDTVIVLFVALLVAFELLPYVVSQGFGKQVRMAAPRDIRVPMFIFVLAEQLCTPFFPLYIRDLYVQIPGLSEQAVIGLPIAMFMLFVALGTIYGGNAISRFGAVRVFRWGVGFASAGFLGLALAYSFYDLLIWRILTAVGYALSTLACQAYVASVSTKDNRTRSMAVFVGAVMVASVCGAAIGGVLADLVGYRYVFIASLALALLSIVVFPRVTGAGQVQGEERASVLPILVSYRILIADRGFSAVILLASIPAKLLLTGAVFFLTPLYLSHLGYDAATIGRCIMIYYLPMAFAASLAAWLADRYHLRLSLVVAGGVIAGLGSMVAWFLSGLPAVLVAMAGLGIGQVLATAPTFSLALAAGQQSVDRVGQAHALAAIRVLERAGSVIGPLLTGSLVVLAGFETALLVIGSIVTVSALLLPYALRGRMAGGEI